MKFNVTIADPDDIQEELKKELEKYFTLPKPTYEGEWLPNLGQIEFNSFEELKAFSEKIGHKCLIFDFEKEPTFEIVNKWCYMEQC